MFKPIYDEKYFIGSLLEGFFYGLYSGIFAMYLQYQASNKDTNKTRSIIFYSICTLYVLCVAVFVCDIAAPTYQLLLSNPMDPMVLRIDFIQTTSFGCSDFIAQFILIYRCWIVWGRNTRVVIIPSILAFAFLATWVTCSSSQHILSGQPVVRAWANPVLLSSLTLSLAVNALVTGLIVFRIFKVFREIKATSDDQILGVTGGSKLRRIILVLIESGMALFSVQLARLVVTIAWLPTGAALRALDIIAAIHNILNGITPTVILVRTSMGLSFHDEKSMEEVAIGSLRFASGHQSSVSETRSIGIVDQDNRGDDDIGIQQNNDIEVVER